MTDPEQVTRKFEAKVERLEHEKEQLQERLDETAAGDSHRYADWKSQIRSELEAMEGAGPPTADQLWNVAAYQSRSAADWIGDMPLTDESIEAARGDVLEALVALEMAEERLEASDA